MTTDMILILGVTASGKATLAYELAQQIDAEIISVDSMKIYRRMDIGTAKPGPERRQNIPYHMIDIVEPSDSFNVGAFFEMATTIIEQIKRRSKRIIAVGGTALYIKALMQGLFEGPGSDDAIRAELRARAEQNGLSELYEELSKTDPAAADKISCNDAKRIIRALEVFRITGRPISSFQTQFDSDKMIYNWKIIGLRREKTLESQRINARVKTMLQAGLVEEVRSLLAEDKPLSSQAGCAIGYAEIIDHLAGNIELDKAIEKIKINTRRFAKGQRTWFKTFRNVNWIDIEPDWSQQQIFQTAQKIIND